MTTFYKRKLPNKLIAFSSTRGKEIFREALSQGTMENFFTLSENLQIQSEPAYCGLGTLTMVLNSLQIDPGRNWKGVWRWFSEEMFDCCTSLATIQKNGLTLDQFWCLSKCNGADSILVRPHKQLDHHDSTMTTTTMRDNTMGAIGSVDVGSGGSVGVGEDEFRQLVKRATAFKSSNHNAHANSGESHVKCSVTCGCGHCGNECTVDQNTFYLVVNFDRKVLEQTGDGHFSVIAGYHERSDMVLLLETARFKYPSYWVPLSDLWKAMDSVDSTSGETRGYLIVRQAAENNSLLYTIFLNHKVSWRQFSLLFSTQIVPNILLSDKNQKSDGSKNLQDLLTLLVARLPNEMESVLLEYCRTLMLESIMCMDHKTDLPGLLNDLRQTPLFPLVQNAFKDALEIRRSEGSTTVDSLHAVNNDAATTTTSNSLANDNDQCTIQFKSIFDAPRCPELIVLLLMTCPIDCLSSIVPGHIWKDVHDHYRDLDHSVTSVKLREEIEKMRKLIQTLCSMKTKPAGNAIAAGILSQCSNTQCLKRCHSSTGDDHLVIN